MDINMDSHIFDINISIKPYINHGIPMKNHHEIPAPSTTWPRGFAGAQLPRLGFAKNRPGSGDIHGNYSYIIVLNSSIL